MAQPEPDSAALERQCRDAVDLLIARRRSELLDRDEFVLRTVASLHGGAGPDPQRAATGVYSLALHTACSGAEGEPRRNLGYIELFRVLYDQARHHYPDVNPEDAAQSAIEHTCRLFMSCRQPVAFLAFAHLQLMNAVRLLRRQEGRRLQSPARPAGAGDASLEAMAAAERPDPAAQVITDEQWLDLNRRAAEFLDDNPRSVKQFLALWMKYVDLLDDPLISQKLDVPLTSLSVLRSRAKKKLRADARWRALAVEFGILPDET